MNRLLVSVSKSAASSPWNNRAASASAHAHSSHSHATTRFLAASSRHFSDSAAADSSGDVGGGVGGGDGGGDDEYKIGMIKSFSFRNQYGFIVPDGVDFRNPPQEDLYFVHRNNIREMEVTADENNNASLEDRFWPQLKGGMRVRFKAELPAEGKNSGQATDVTMEDGNLVPPFLPGYLDNYVKRQESTLGKKVYHIFSASSDQEEMESKLVAAYEEAKNAIEMTKEKVKRADVLYSTTLVEDLEKAIEEEKQVNSIEEGTEEVTTEGEAEKVIA